MPVEWRVTYAVHPPIPGTGAEPFILALDVDLVYGPDGALTGVVHTVQTIVSDMDAAYRNSYEQLLTFWHALKYSSGVKYFMVQTIGAETVGGSQTRIAIGGSTFTTKETKAPDPTKLNVGETRLATWLRFANAALVDRDEAGALHQYYVIIEDIHNGRPGGTNPELAKVGFARDFVSHGKITGEGARAFLAAELGYTTASYQYDAYDPAHRALVRKYKEVAEKAVAAELNKYL